MLDMLNKYKISILWSISLIILFSGIIIGSWISPFSSVQSAIIIFVSFNAALLAMLFSAKKRNDKIKMYVYAFLMLILTINTINKLI